MEPLTLLNNVAIIVSLIVGGAGLALGLCNYFRDKAKVEVQLVWDRKRTDADGLFGVVTVVNTGRRPICVSCVKLQMPNKEVLLLLDGAKPITLPEGAPPTVYLVNYEHMGHYKSQWQEITAEVSDTSGKVWKSKKVQDKPSWAE